jgi:hypothetical protein
MKYWQKLKSIIAICLLIILILSCQKKEGKVIRGYIEADAELQLRNFCGVSDVLQILVTTESGKSVWFKVPEEYWQGSDLLSKRTTDRRIYVEGRYYDSILGNCDEYVISFAYLK